MLKIDCDVCGEELKKPGALMFDPPIGELSTCLKHHVCVHCYQWLWNALKESNVSPAAQGLGKKRDSKELCDQCGEPPPKVCECGGEFCTESKRV